MSHTYPLLLPELHAVHPPVRLRPADVDGQPVDLRLRLLQRRPRRQVLQAVRSAEGAGTGGEALSAWGYVLGVGRGAVAGRQGAGLGAPCPSRVGFARSGWTVSEQELGRHVGWLMGFFLHLILLDVIVPLNVS